MTTTTRRAPRRMSLGEAWATHCRLTAAFMRSGLPLPPDAAAIHADQLEKIAAHLAGEPVEEAGPALPLIGA